MKYALLVRETLDSMPLRTDPAMQAAGRAFGEALMTAGVFVAGAGLQPPGETAIVSVREGKRHVHDGPYAETKEFLGGFVIIEVPDHAAALDWAARHPIAAHAAIEVRPLTGGYFATAR